MSGRYKIYFATYLYNKNPIISHLTGREKVDDNIVTLEDNCQKQSLFIFNVRQIKSKLLCISIVQIIEIKIY